MVMRVDEQARRIWSVLAERAQRQDSQIYYSNLADKIGYRSARLSRPLGMIQTYCEVEGLAPLTILVIEKETDQPGSGFTAWDSERIGAGVDAVRNEKWSRDNPFGYSSSGVTVGDRVKFILTDPARAEEIYALVKSRGIRQLIFRQAVLQAYRMCAICGLTISACLQAAHIVPYSRATEVQKINPKNGLLLCANHHLMFDRHQFTISPEGIVRYNNSNPTNSNCGHNHTATTHLDGKRAFLPEDKRNWPEASGLEEHHAIFESKLAKARKKI